MGRNWSSTFLYDLGDAPRTKPRAPGALPRRAVAALRPYPPAAMLVPNDAPDRSPLGQAYALLVAAVLAGAGGMTGRGGAVAPPACKAAKSGCQVAGNRRGLGNADGTSITTRYGVTPKSPPLTLASHARLPRPWPLPAGPRPIRMFPQTDKRPPLIGAQGSSEAGGGLSLYERDNVCA
jgi:hypothetical protein